MSKLSDYRYITWDKEDDPTPQEIAEIVNEYLVSPELTLLSVYNNYYDVENNRIKHKQYDRSLKDITPNEVLPSAYYKTVVDTKAGYMFSNVVYTAKDETGKEYADALNEILEDNDADIKDMKTGINALAFNKGVEIVYTEGDKKTAAKVKFVSIDPRQMIFVYDDKIEPTLKFGIRVIESNDKNYDYDVDVIFSKKWQSFKMIGSKIEERKPEKTLLFDECPVIDYRAEIINNRSPYHQILNYIDALDALLTGNTNDIQTLADAILKLSAQLKDADKKHLDRLKVIDGMSKDEIAEYITKDMSPEFRQYVSDLFVKEIHKHSHTVDWFSDATGGSEASARALRIRLFDMRSDSKRIEKVFIKGLHKRVRLIDQVMKVSSKEPAPIKIVMNREEPDNYLDLLPILSNVTFLDDKTKLKELGYSNADIETIMQAKTEQAEKNMELFNSQTNEDDTEDNNVDDDQE